MPLEYYETYIEKDIRGADFSTASVTELFYNLLTVSEMTLDTTTQKLTFNELGFTDTLNDLAGTEYTFTPTLTYGD